MQEDAFDYGAMGARIRACRRELKLTQEKLAERVGISNSFVGHIERGEKEASLETVFQMSRALDVSLDYTIAGRRNKCDGISCALFKDLKKLIGTYEQ